MHPGKLILLFLPYIVRRIELAILYRTSAPLVTAYISVTEADASEKYCEHIS